jgi:hypothetical protein
MQITLRGESGWLLGLTKTVYPGIVRGCGREYAQSYNRLSVVRGRKKDDTS